MPGPDGTGGQELVLTTDRGVSSVISVVLMVAVTVILAAIIATFALGLGEQVSNTAPQATFDCGGTAGDWDIKLTDGSNLDTANLAIDGTAWSNLDPGLYTIRDTGTLSSGQGITGYSGGTGTITWESDTGETSATLYAGCTA